MLHSIVCPSMGHSIVHHFGVGAAVWGQSITPSIAHLVQSHRELSIDYSRVRPGIVFETEMGRAMLPHVIDASTFRLHAEAAAFRHAVGRMDATVEAFVRLDVGGECTLKLWGRVASQKPLRLEPSGNGNRDSVSTIPVIFTVTFWEISRASDARLDQLLRQSAEKDHEIQELRAKVALAMSSQ